MYSEWAMGTEPAAVHMQTWRSRPLSVGAQGQWVERLLVALPPAPNLWSKGKKGTEQPTYRVFVLDFAFLWNRRRDATSVRHGCNSAPIVTHLEVKASALHLWGGGRIPNEYFALWEELRGLHGQFVLQCHINGSRFGDGAEGTTAL